MQYNNRLYRVGDSIMLAPDADVTTRLANERARARSERALKNLEADIRALKYQLEQASKK